MFAKYAQNKTIRVNVAFSISTFLSHHTHSNWNNQTEHKVLWNFIQKWWTFFGYNVDFFRAYTYNFNSIICNGFILCNQIKSHICRTVCLCQSKFTIGNV